MSTHFKACMDCDFSCTNSSRGCNILNSVGVDLALPTGTCFHNYQVGAVLSHNGDCTVYATINDSGEKVWLVEFLPINLVSRSSPSLSLEVKTDCNTRFQYFRASFFDLYSTLKNFSGIDCFLPISDLFEENNTVYVAIPYVKLITLSEYLSKESTTPPWCKAKMYLLPLFNGISNLHKKGVFHYGIHPDNILLDENLKPYLWGFSMEEVRMSQGELEPELFPGFSAPEQYKAQSWRGTWTDVYSLAALTYWVLTGISPPEAVSRLESDSLIPAMEKDFTIAENISDAISKALSPDVKDRYQSVDEYTEKLLESLSSNTAVFQVDPQYTVNSNTIHITSEQNMENSSGTLKPASNRYIFIPMVVTLSLLIVFGMVVYNEFLPSFAISSQAVTVPSNNSSNLQNQEDSHAIPNFSGKVAQSLIKDTANYSLYSFTITEEYDDNIPEGQVISQKPSPGTNVFSKTNVSLTVSKGPGYVTMPNLYNSSEYYAIEQLTALNLKYKVVSAQNDDVSVGKIFRTQPSSGTQIRKNSTDIVLLYVAEKKPEVPVVNEPVVEPPVVDDEEPEDTDTPQVIIKRKEKPEVTDDEPFNPFIER